MRKAASSGFQSRRRRNSCLRTGCRQGNEEGKREMKKAKGKRQGKGAFAVVAPREARRVASALPRAFFIVILNFCLLPFSFCLFLCLSAQAQGWAQQPPPLSSEDPSAGKVRLLENVGIDQRLGERIPLELEFRDENGTPVRLGDFFGKKPVILTLVYYTCPMLCNQVLNGLTSGLDVVSFDIGKDFEVVTVSFDPREKPELARDKKETYIQWYKRPGAAAGWHFLTGDKASIDQLTE